MLGGWHPPPRCRRAAWAEWVRRAVCAGLSGPVDRPPSIHDEHCTVAMESVVLGVVGARRRGAGRGRSPLPHKRPPGSPRGRASRIGAGEGEVHPTQRRNLATSRPKAYGARRCGPAGFPLTRKRPAGTPDSPGGRGGRRHPPAAPHSPPVRPGVPSPGSTMGYTSACALDDGAKRGRTTNSQRRYRNMTGFDYYNPAELRRGRSTAWRVRSARRAGAAGDRPGAADAWVPGSSH